MRHRRQGMQEEDMYKNTANELPPHDNAASPPAALTMTNLMLLVLMLIALFLLHLHWNRPQVDLSVFFACRSEHDSPNEDASPCIYFRPTRYYNHQGLAYKHLIDESNIQWTMWAKHVSEFHKPRQGASLPNKFLQQHGIASVSVIMMPKVASRSLETLFHERLSVPVEERILHQLKGPRIGIATPAYWKEVAQRQQNTTTHKDIVFALLRDPVSRFLSSLAQTLSTPMQHKHKACADLWKPCLETSISYKELVQCALNTMMERDQYSRYFDVHVVPQAAFLAGTLDGNDVEVAIFSIESLEKVMQAFGMSQHQHYNTRDQKEFTQDVMNRFGDELLNSNKARQVLNGDMIQDICKLYEMDVTLMHHLAFSAGECDDDKIQADRRPTR